MAGTRVASLYAEIGSDTSGLKRGLAETKSGLEGAKKGLATFKASALGVAAAVVGVAAAARKIYDLGKAGAELEYTRERFDRLASSIGTTGDKLRTELGQATRGMISDSEAMASAADLMALGLAKTEDEAIRLTRLSSQLGFNMNQLVLTLTNQTTMRFDALGVSVDGFKERVDALKQSGMSANDAFKEAFLQQAEAQVAKVGDRADSAAGAYDRLGSAVKNTSDLLKVQVSEGLTPTIIKLTGFIEKANAQTVLLGKLDKAFQYGAISAEDWSDAVLRQSRTTEEYAPLLEWVNQRMQEYADSNRDARERIYELTGGVETVTGSFEELNPELAAFNRYADAGGRQAYKLAKEIADGARETKHLQDNLSALMDLDPNFFSQIDSTLEKIDWKKAGGGDIEEAVNAASAAFDTGQIDVNQYKDILDKAAVEAIVLQGNIEGLNNVEISEHLTDQLGTPPEQALALVKEMQSALNAMTAREYIIRILAKQSIITQSTTGGKFGPKVPGQAAGGPVYKDRGYIVGEHGPEYFEPSTSGRIYSTHETNRMGGGDVYVDFTINTLPGQDTNAIASRVVQMLRGGGYASRAGAGYAGA